MIAIGDVVELVDPTIGTSCDALVTGFDASGDVDAPHADLLWVVPGKGKGTSKTMKQSSVPHESTVTGKEICWRKHGARAV